MPGSWFVVGTLVAGTACVILGHWLFEITWWMGIIAVLLTFVLSIVAARATGETDVTPIGAMGKITQLLYGFVAPTNMTTNLMTASITAGAASHSADLLTDLKSGYLLGGNAAQTNDLAIVRRAGGHARLRAGLHADRLRSGKVGL